MVRIHFAPSDTEGDTGPLSMTLTGGSWWGQFVDDNESVNPALRDRFCANLQYLRLDALWSLFPLPAMITRAPLQAFYDFYAP